MTLEIGSYLGVLGSFFGIGHHFITEILVLVVRGNIIA